MLLYWNCWFCFAIRFTVPFLNHIVPHKNKTGTSFGRNDTDNNDSVPRDDPHPLLHFLEDQKKTFDRATPAEEIGDRLHPLTFCQPVS